MTIPEGFAQVTHVFGGGSCPRGAVVTYGIEHSGIVTPAFVADAAGDAWDAEMLTSQVATCTHVSVEVKFGPDDTGPSASNSRGTIGTAGGAGASPQVAFLAQKSTALGGRRGRGRLFIPGVAEGAVDVSGVVAGASFTQLAGDLTSFLASLDTKGIPMVLLHDPPTEWVLVAGQPRRVPVAGSVPVPTPVTSLDASSTISTQRRRVRG